MNFHRHFIFYLFYSTLFLCYWCFRGLSLRVSLAIESLKLELHIRSFKIPKEKRSSLVIFSVARATQCRDREDNIRPLPEANLTAVHCACLKALSTQAPHSVLTWLSTTMPVLKTGDSWSMGLPTVTQVVWDTQECKKIPHGFSFGFYFRCLFFIVYHKLKIEKGKEKKKIKSGTIT